MPDLRLPSERERPGDPRRVGFQTYPSHEHYERSADAARALVKLASMSQPATARSLRVCLCHVRLAPRLPFNLFGFHINGISDEGEFVDDLAEDAEIRYALVVNQPVELQREVAVAFLNDLVGRQGPLADIVADRRSLRDLPDMTAAADAASAEASSDTLRFSLAHAIDALKTRAATLGYRLELRYQPDPLPRREDVARRVAVLRELYDSQEDVRAAVDGTVSMLGGSPLTLRGGREQVRAWTQQHTALMGVRQFMNQCARDADVCGNGFLEFGFLGLDPTIRSLKPEAVEILDDDHFVIHGDGSPRHAERVAHLRGLEQFESPYGISPWEPLLYVLQREQILRGAREHARAVLAAHGAPEEAWLHAEGLIRVAEAMERDTRQRLDQLLWFPRRMLPEAPGDLYFSGRERLGS